MNSRIFLLISRVGVGLLGKEHPAEPNLRGRPPTPAPRLSPFMTFPHSHKDTASASRQSRGTAHVLWAVYHVSHFREGKFLARKLPPLPSSFCRCEKFTDAAARQETRRIPSDLSQFMLDFQHPSREPTVAVALSPASSFPFFPKPNGPARTL